MKKSEILKGFLVVGMVLALIMIENSDSFAQKGYPNKEIEIVITFSAGGMADQAFRTINEELAKVLGVPVVLVNKAGASGTIGAHYVSQSNPDGYTLMGTSASTIVIAPLVLGKIPYKYSDIVPIAQFVSTPQMFAVKKDAPWKTLAELISYAKKNPGKLTCGTVGVGSSPHFTLEMLKLEAGIDVQHIPFKGGGETHAAILGGHIDIAATTLNPSLPLLQSGDLRALATSSRIKEFPKVPTMAEAGYPGATLISWVGCFGPKGIEKSAVDKIANALEKTVKNPSVAKRLEETGSQADFVGKEEFGRKIDEDLKRLAEIVKKANIAVQ
jgi:tripartite-type tricarboxylate transporter receptor subunit TctC